MDLVATYLNLLFRPGFPLTAFCRIFFYFIGFCIFQMFIQMSTCKTLVWAVFFSLEAI